MKIINPSAFRNRYNRDGVRKKKFRTTMSQPFLERMNEAIEGKHRSAFLETSGLLMLICLDNDFDDDTAKYIAEKIKGAINNDTEKVRQFVANVTRFTNILVEESKNEKELKVEDLVNQPW